MRISELRREVSEALVAFAWDQWAQMGVSASTGRRDRWVADPEALLLLTFEVGRDDPRLFDEVLDWLVVNERLISVQRIRNLARDEEDRALVEAALGWLSRWRPRPRLAARATGAPAGDGATGRPLFRAAHAAIQRPDDAFLRHGLLRAHVAPSHKSQAPDLDAPINFAFRIRHLLGVGARAEVMRALLCSDAPRLSVFVIAEAAGYAKRNVQEALTSLARARVIDSITIANEQRYGAPRDRWAQLLHLDKLPALADWPQLFHALRRILRWVHEPGAEGLSDYMLASEARVLMEELAPELRFAGVAAYDSHARGVEYWPQFVETVRAAVSAVS